MLTFKLEELSQRTENELSVEELDNVIGGGIGTFLRDAIIGGAIYDGIKAGFKWQKENLPVDTLADQQLRQYNLNPTIIRGVDVTGVASNIA